MGVVRLYNLTGEQKYFDFATYIVDRGCTDIVNIFDLAYAIYSVLHKQTKSSAASIFKAKSKPIRPTMRWAAKYAKPSRSWAEQCPRIFPPRKRASKPSNVNKPSGLTQKSNSY